MADLQDKPTKHIDDLNDPVLRGLAMEYDRWLDGVKWVLGDVSKHDLEMLADDQGGERAAPGPDKRLVEMTKRLMRYARD